MSRVLRIVSAVFKDGDELVEYFKGDEVAPEHLDRPEIVGALEGDEEQVDAAAETPADDEPAGDEPVDYSKLKQPELKALLDERKIEYPSGPVRNDALVELLVAADAAAETPTE